jgi:hypothetical protein
LTISLSLAQASDPFMGTGSLNANGWILHSGTTPGQQTIAAGSLTYSGMTSQGNKTQIIAGNSEDLNLASAADITGTAYYSLLLNVTTATGLVANTDASGAYFVHTSAGAGVTGTMGNAFQAKLCIKAGSVADTFNLAIFNTASTGTPTFSTTDYNVGTTYFIVVKYDFGTNTASLWVNPAIGGTETAPTITNNTGTGAAPTQIRSIAIRQAGNATAGTGSIDLDEIRLGSTWAYVTSDILRTNQNAISGLRVYPNPVTNGTLFIETSANADRKVAIFDVLGKKVLSTSTNDNTVNVGSLNAGVYIVKITEEGKTASRKLVIR